MQALAILLLPLLMGGDLDTPTQPVATATQPTTQPAEPLSLTELGRLWCWLEFLEGQNIVERLKLTVQYSIGCQARLSYVEKQLHSAEQTIDILTEFMAERNNGPDLNRDGVVDHEDLGIFRRCMTPPGVPTNKSCQNVCWFTDFDGDGDTDMDDFGVMQRSLTATPPPIAPTQPVVD